MRAPGGGEVGSIENKLKALEELGPLGYDKHWDTKLALFKKKEKTGKKEEKTQKRKTLVMGWLGQLLCICLGLLLPNSCETLNTCIRPRMCNGWFRKVCKY